MINIGVIGCGYWGPNLIRNLNKVKDCCVVAVADQRADRLEAVKHLKSDMKATTIAGELVDSDSIDAIVIATPISTHFDLARACLARGKHVLIEKPITKTVAQAEELIRLAEKKSKVLMVDHTFIYSGAVRKLRRTLIGGSRKMVVYDHLDSDNQIKIFDKGIELREDQDRYNVLVQYRMGDLLIPKVDQTEALETACKHFVHCIKTGEKPITDGYAGLRVVELLEAAERAMKNERKSSRIWRSDNKLVSARA